MNPSDLGLVNCPGLDPSVLAEIKKIEQPKAKDFICVPDEFMSAGCEDCYFYKSDENCSTGLAGLLQDKFGKCSRNGHHYQLKQN